MRLSLLLLKRIPSSFSKSSEDTKAMSPSRSHGKSLHLSPAGLPTRGT